MDEIYKNSICRIICGKEKGTGFVVANNLILTVKHVVVEAIISEKDIVLSFVENQEDEYKAELIAFDDDLDIAVLKTEFVSTNETLKLLKRPIFCEDKWCTSGFSNTQTGQLAGDELKGFHR